MALGFSSVKTTRVVDFRIQILAGTPSKMLALRLGNMASAAGPLFSSVPLILGIVIPCVCGWHLEIVEGGIVVW
jgi:hypothetical protein